MKRILDCEYIDQSVRWPTGCESVSTVMALRFLGLPITVDEFIREDLPCRNLKKEKGVLYGPDPDEYFIGDPHTDEGSYGCYAGAILKALDHVRRRYPEFEWQGVDETGTETGELIRRYVDQGVPVVYWATMDMLPSAYYGSWRLEESGQELVWKSKEHCLLLTGRDEEAGTYIFHDPWKNNGIISWPAALVEQRHREMFSYAVGFARVQEKGTES